MNNDTTDADRHRRSAIGDNKDRQAPPRAPDRTPVKEPERKEESPKGDPIPPDKKKPRLR